MEINQLKEINQKVASYLFNMRSEFEPTLNVKKLPIIKLIFPRYRDNSNGTYVRTSEQEAKALFAKVLDSYECYYSVETPTTEIYSFSGTTERSGNIDLCIHNDKLERIINVELKAHNVELSILKKDFNKLFREPEAIKNWFHILLTANSNTYSNITDKYFDAIKENLEHSREGSYYLLNLAVLNDKLLYQKLFKHNELTTITKEELNIKSWECI